MPLGGLGDALLHGLDAGDSVQGLLFDFHPYSMQSRCAKEGDSGFVRIEERGEGVREENGDKEGRKRVRRGHHIHFSIQ